MREANSAFWQTIEQEDKYAHGKGIGTQVKHTGLIHRCIAACVAAGLLVTMAACGDNVDPNEPVKPSASGVSGDFAGAGASSQQAAVEAWVASFQKKNPHAKISYNPSGSGAGIITFFTGATAWASSDKPLSDDEVTQSKQVCASGNAFDIPVYIAPIAIAFNLPGISDADHGKAHLNMDAATIAKIFNGKITKWNDPAIARQNPDVTLPDLDITTVRRSDKSGTTLNVVKYLKANAPHDWPYEVSENWPNDVGQGAKGTSGIVSTLNMAPGTIGYADYSQVGDLGTVALQVGQDYSPISAEAASAAIEDSPLDTKVPGENRVVIDVNYTTQAEGAYPLVLVSYNIVCPVYKDKDGNTGTFAHDWMAYITSDKGQHTATQATGSAPLPKNLTKRINESISAIEVQ